MTIKFPSFHYTKWRVYESHELRKCERLRNLEIYDEGIVEKMKNLVQIFVCLSGFLKCSEGIDCVFLNLGEGYTGEQYHLYT